MNADNGYDAYVVDLLDCWMFNLCYDEFSKRLVLLIERHAWKAAWKTRLSRNIAGGLEAAGRELGTFQNSGITACEGMSYGSETENV